jgi:hypothetical protein
LMHDPTNAEAIGLQEALPAESDPETLFSS